jgi:hypothetical protein
LTVENAVLQEKLGRIGFTSATYRLWKIDGLEAACEDYGQAVIYKGTMAGNAHGFALDKHHNIEIGRIFPVCGNTYRMLHESRFAPHFEFIGTWETHYGIFSGCGDVIPFGGTDVEVVEASTSGCCR